MLRVSWPPAFRPLDKYLCRYYAKLTSFQRLAIPEDLAMKNLLNIAIRGLKTSLHVFMVSFVLVLPIGYYPNSSDSGDIIVGVYGGTGQVASVLRDCDGNALHTEKSSFRDLGGLVSWTLASEGRTKFVIGVRGGYWEVGKARFAQSFGTNIYGSTPEIFLHDVYLNPNFSIEGKNLGFGFGVLIGDVPILFDDSYYIEPFSALVFPYYNDRVPFSTHLRIGNHQKVYFITSLAENTPIISGGGIFNLGFGYPAGKNARMYSGLTVGFYDRPGFLQHVQFPLSNKLNGEISIRIGGAGDAFEGSFSGGVIYRIGGK